MLPEPVTVGAGRGRARNHCSHDFAVRALRGLRFRLPISESHNLLEQISARRPTKGGSVSSRCRGSIRRAAVHGAIIHTAEARSFVTAVLARPTSETPVSIAAVLARISTPEIFRILRDRLGPEVRSYPARPR